MNAMDRLRIEKAAADCGFEMTTAPYPDGLELRSARFPETVMVRVSEKNFEASSSDPALLDLAAGGTLKVRRYGDLYAVLRAGDQSRSGSIFKLTNAGRPIAAPRRNPLPDCCRK